METTIVYWGYHFVAIIVLYGNATISRAFPRQLRRTEQRPEVLGEALARLRFKGAIFLPGNLAMDL